MPRVPSSRNKFQSQIVVFVDWKGGGEPRDNYLRYECRFTTVLNG